MVSIGATWTVRVRIPGALLGVLVILASAASSASAARVIAVEPDAVQPSRVVLHLGDAVRWHNRDKVAHRVVSDPVGLFRTNRVAPTDTSERVFFNSAGTFRYALADNSGISGAVRVPIKLRPGPNVSPTPGTLITLRLGTERRNNWVYDVQRKRNDGQWLLIAKRTPKVRLKIQLQSFGTYLFRARVTNQSSGATSRWSPPRKEVLNTPPP